MASPGLAGQVRTPDKGIDEFRQVSCDLAEHGLFGFVGVGASTLFGAGGELVLWADGSDPEVDAPVYAVDFESPADARSPATP